MSQVRIRESPRRCIACIKPRELFALPFRATTPMREWCIAGGTGERRIVDGTRMGVRQLQGTDRTADLLAGTHRSVGRVCRAVRIPPALAGAREPAVGLSMPVLGFRGGRREATARPRGVGLA